MILDADGNVNDANANPRMNEDDDGDLLGGIDDNPESKARFSKIKENINR